MLGKKTIGCHNLIIAMRAQGGARGGRPAARRAVGARAPLAPTPTHYPPTEQASDMPVQHAGDKRPMVKQKECCRRRFEAPAPPVPAP